MQTNTISVKKHRIEHRLISNPILASIILLLEEVILYKKTRFLWYRKKSIQLKNSCLSK